MAVTASTFRTGFAEFASATKYPDTMINFWLDLAGKLISADRWGELYDMAVMLFIAHNITMAAAAIAGKSGGASVVASKSVGSVNTSYDNSNTMELGAGHWNQTEYGRRYIHFARMIGAGCAQV